jgi:hypothetical protein
MLTAATAAPKISFDTIAIFPSLPLRGAADLGEFFAKLPALVTGTGIDSL